MTKTIFIFLLFVIAVPAAMAQTTRTAATCFPADIQAQVNLSANGDTVIIPAGTCTWNTVGVTVPAGIGITIAGTGAPNSLPTQFGASATCQQTIITDALTAGRTMISMTPSSVAVPPSATSRLSCMRVNPTVPSTGYNNPFMIVGVCSVSTCPNLRLDNLYFPTTWVQNPILVSDNTMVVKSNVFGVGDHNTVGDALASSGAGIDFINENNGNYLAVGTWGDNTWAQPDVAGGFQSFYLENNQLLNSFLTDTDTSGASFGGGRFVCRFNQVTSINTTSGICANHGTDTNGRNRGGRIFEAYYNTGTCTVDGFGTTGCGSTWPGRSSTGIIFGNTFTNGTGGNLKSMANIDNQRRWRTNSTWGLCDGSSPWDANDTNGGGGNTAFVYYTGTVASFAVTGPGSQELLVTVNAGGTGTVPPWGANIWATIGAPWSMHDSTHTGGAEVNLNGSNTLTLNVPDQHNSSLANIAIGDTIVIQRSFSCMDQAGRGKGLLVTGPVNGTNPVLQSTGSPGNVAEVLDPVYEGGDSLPAGAANTIASDTNSLIANRDFYRESVNQAAQASATSPFNGTSGTGHGTLALRPTTCTTSVGYFATDQGTWDTSGGGHKGVLYLCTSTNTWTLSWTPGTYPHPLVTSSVTVSPSTENFGSVVVGASSATQSTTLTNGTAASITISSVTTTGNTSDFPNTANTCSGTIAGNGGTCSVTTKFSPTSTGARAATLTIATSAGSFPVALSGTGTSAVNPGVSISPAFIAFGNQSVGAPTPGTVVTITSTTSANLVMGTPPATISGANAGDFNLQAVGGQCSNGQSIPQSSTCVENVVFLPTATGARSAQLNIFDNVTGSPQVVTLSGTGVGTIAINPATLNYGLVAQGQTSASQLLTITNNTGVTLTLTGTSFSNLDFASTSNTCNSGSLTNGSSCTATITFRPSATTGTNETGFFNVGYTGVGGSPVQTPLSGTVLPPIGTPATNIFASNLAGCGGPPRVATWCFTADRHIYISSCSGVPLVCGPYTPFTLMAQ